MAHKYAYLNYGQREMLHVRPVHWQVARREALRAMGAPLHRRLADETAWKYRRLRRWAYWRIYHPVKWGLNPLLLLDLLRERRYIRQHGG